MATIATQFVPGDDQLRRIRWSRWIGGTFAGWTAGFFLAIACILIAETAGLGTTQFPLAVGMGAGVGLAQARLLGARVGSRTMWVAGTSVGLAAPFIVFDLSGLLDVLCHSCSLCTSHSADSAWRCSRALS